MPAFVRFWLGRIATSAGGSIMDVAVGWQVYDITRKPLDLGLAGLAAFLPIVLLSLVSGSVADRYDRRRVAATCQIVKATALAVLAVGSALHAASFHFILAVVAVVGSATAFEMPAMSALLPAMVPAASLPRAISVSSSARQTAAIFGPALGGLLYAIGPVFVYSVCAAMFLVAAGAVGGIATTLRVRAAEPARRAVFAGLSFIRSQPAILGSLSLDLFAVLLGGATALLPVYARDILHAGPLGLGALRAAPAAGALVMSVLLARRPLRSHAGVAMFGAVVVFGLATIGFGLSRVMWLSVASLVVLGAADLVSVVVRISLVQLRTPDAMRGRVAAVNSLFIGTSNELGAFESGALASVIGSVPAVVVGGVGTILVALLWMRLFPELRRLQRV